MRKGDRLLQLGFGGGETPISLLSITQSKAFETPGISTSGTLQRRTISAHLEEMSHSAASCQGLLCVQWGPLCPLVTRLCIGFWVGISSGTPVMQGSSATPQYGVPCGM